MFIKLLLAAWIATLPLLLLSVLLWVSWGFYSVILGIEGCVVDRAVMK
jgi:hypothetical protein